MTKRTLILMRHAKSSWTDNSLSDHERPLNQRGRLAAATIAEWLLAQKLVPDVVLCSSAARTRETADLMGQTGLSLGRFTICDRLYLAPASTILDVIAESSDGSAQRVLVLGHNPGMENLASILAGQAIVMPTASVCVFEFESLDQSWSVPFDSGRIKFTQLIEPRALQKELDGD